MNLKRKPILVFFLKQETLGFLRKSTFVIYHLRLLVRMN